MYERVLVSTLRKGSRSLLLLGPRQVGKSTLLASLEPDRTINLASPSTYRDYVMHPERFEQELDAAGPSVRTILLDEVQRVPALLDVVQVVTDQRPRRFRFLLSGSSARKLRRGNANLLPGRIHVHELHPLMACEMGGDFDLGRVMAHGSLPGIYTEADVAARGADLRAYVDTYLREEIQAEALVRDVGAYGRLLELVAAGSGRIINLNALCREAGISYETARRYMDVLRDTLVAFDVPAWSRNDRAGLVAHAKTFLFDAGVRNALLRRPLDRPLDDERGILLEHVVAYELHRRCGSLWPNARLYHYRTRGGTEVDFVLERGRELWAIEVKAGREVGTRQTASIQRMAETERMVKRKILVYQGTHRRKSNDIEIVPVLDFLSELASI